MRTPRLLKSYSRLSETSLNFKAEMVIINLTDNPYFLITTPTLADFTVIRETYNDALKNSADGNKTAIALKNQAKKALLTAMKNLATNVESLAQGDRAKLVSSGFDLGSDGENIPELGTPTNFELSDGLNPGELKLSVKTVPNAIAYLHEYTEGPLTDDSVWISKASSSREHTFKGIRSGIRAYSRVAAIGRKGQEAYSNILYRVVQ